MRTFFFIILSILALSTNLFAQSDTLKPRLRLSLLTCGTGDLVYETFGHTAIRVIDSNIDGPLRDIVYNYGMFNGYEENFELKFMRGKLNYYVATNLFPDFMEEYAQYGRSVEEQELILEEKYKIQINEFLKNNALPENRDYKYDFFFDNCATRIRDIFPKVLGDQFHYSSVIPNNSQQTFRDIINIYFYRRHWERVGVNVLLGSKIDKVMSNKDIMFLPDYLRDGLAGSSFGIKKISTKPKLILEGLEVKPSGINIPLWSLLILFSITFLGLTLPYFKILAIFSSRFVFFISGILGVIIFIMWFATDHQGCSANANLLWALPTNIILAIGKPKGRKKYAAISAILIFVTLLLHVLRIQAIILEFIPLLATLLVTYLAILREKI